MLRQGFVAPVRHGASEGPIRRAPAITFMGLVIYFAMAILLGTFLYFAQFSGTVRWALGLGFLALLAALAWGQVVRRTAEPAPLVPAAAPVGIVSGELETFAAAVRRAERGLPYSQVLVAARARDAFLERARLSLGLSPEAMREIQGDADALMERFGDAELAEFVHVRNHDLEERYRWVEEARDHGGWSIRFRGVLDRMEAWR